MRLRTTLIAAAVAILPLAAIAQTAPQTTAPPTTAPGVTAPTGQPKPHHDRASHRQRRAELKAKYEQLSPADKAKFDDLTKQIRDLHHQRMQLLGMSK